MGYLVLVPFEFQGGIFEIKKRTSSPSFHILKDIYSKSSHTEAKVFVNLLSLSIVIQYYKQVCSTLTVSLREVTQRRRVLDKKTDHTLFIIDELHVTNVKHYDGTQKV